MYNSTPHTTTGKTPTELLRGKSIRSKIPAVRDIEVAPPPGDGTSDRDAMAKARGGASEDSRRRAQESSLTIGDTVVLKNQSITNKLTPTFADEDYTVINKSGSRLTVQNNETGKTYDRTTSHVKKIAEPVVNGEATVEEEAFVPEASSTPAPPKRSTRIVQRSKWQQDYV